jgi:hypothetical protein
MQGNPSQWTVGSAWIARGGVYPGSGETIGLAGTSPEYADGGMYDDGGGVGDPPFDAYQNEYYNDQMGAGVSGAAGGAGGYDETDVAGALDEPDWFNGHILAGALSAIVLGGLVFFVHHKTSGLQEGHHPIRWTIGEIGLVTVAAGTGLPAFKTVLTWLGTRVPIVAPIADYVNS